VGDLDLSVALGPLYLGYLRRLDEMAKRVPAAALLRESTTRGPLGELTLGADGLPLVFDVADANTKETFEVHGSTADAPAIASGSIGGVQVALEPGNWEALPLEIFFEGRPTDRDLLNLAELVRAWAVLASQGAFSALASGPRNGWSGRLHSIKLAATHDTLSAVLDLGTSPPQALTALIGALDGVGRDSLSVARVALGG